MTFAQMTSAQATAQPTPDARPSEKDASLVFVSPFDEDHRSLGRFLISTGFRIYRARNREEARAALRRNRVAVVISESKLPEGDWRDVLKELESFAEPPLLIVTSQHADNHLWAEVLNLGGHDVLLKPFHASEVIRVVSLACKRWASLQENKPGLRSN